MRIPDVDTGLPVTFANSNNVTFGTTGESITASVTVASTQGSINLSAGTTSNLASAFTFSNSNGVSFGLNASTITASVATSLTNINISAGTTSNNLSAVTFSNSNSISFGINASTLTASYNFNLSAGTTSNNLNAVVFSNSNNVSFGLNGSTVTATVHAQLTELAEAGGVREIMITTMAHDHADRRRSYELLADAFSLAPLPSTGRGAGVSSS